MGRPPNSRGLNNLKANLKFVVDAKDVELPEEQLVIYRQLIFKLEVDEDLSLLTKAFLDKVVIASTTMFALRDNLKDRNQLGSDPKSKVMNRIAAVYECTVHWAGRCRT